jgi:hypothetical protein
MTKKEREALPVAISYSGGASSEWMVRAVINGTIPRPDLICVVFADTGSEHSWTYDAVAEVKTACDAASIEFITSAAETSLCADLMGLAGADAVTRIDQPPFWISKGHGRGRAQHRCTAHYKVAPMRRAVSEWLTRHGRAKAVEKWIGFAADEAHRATKAIGKQDVAWEHLEFPAINLGVDRTRQRADIQRWTGRTPRFSMCVFCPFKSPRRWMQTEADDLATALAVDEAIRDLDCIGLTDGPAFLTDRLIPIADLVSKGDPQPDLPGLESYCDGGACFL